MATRGFSFKGLVDYVLALKDSVIANTTKIDTAVTEVNAKIDGLTATDVGALPTSAVSSVGGWNGVLDKLVKVKTNGVASIGKYLDFYEEGDPEVDYKRIVRIGNTIDVQAELTERGKRVYSGNNKPTPADIGAVATGDSWREPFKTLGAVNFDSLTESGLYYVAGSLAGSTNAPMGDAVFLRVATRHGTDWVTQEAFSYYSPRDKYFRVFNCKTQANIPWQSYYTTAFKPTLRDIESAPNARGETENLMDIISELRAEIADLKTKVG